MFKINLQGDDYIYTKYTERLERFEIGRKFTDKYSKKDFSSKLFEKAILNLTDQQILDILEGLELREYHQLLAKKESKLNEGN